jgi:hypothetical protein
MADPCKAYIMGEGEPCGVCQSCRAIIGDERYDDQGHVRGDLPEEGVEAATETENVLRDDDSLSDLTRLTQDAYDEAELAKRGLIREAEKRIDLMQHSGASRRRYAQYVNARLCPQGCGDYLVESTYDGEPITKCEECDWLGMSFENAKELLK